MEDPRSIFRHLAGIAIAVVTVTKYVENDEREKRGSMGVPFPIDASPVFSRSFLPSAYETYDLDRDSRSRKATQLEVTPRILSIRSLIIKIFPSPPRGMRSYFPAFVREGIMRKRE